MRRVHSEESGIALVSVISLSSILALLAVAGIAFSVSSYTKARDDQDYNGALAAAYAAVEEYQSRLANNPAYVRFGNPASKYTSYVNPTTPSDTSDMSIVSLPATTNPAFGVGKTGTWADVPGSSSNAQYRYEVNNAHYDSEGTLTLRATGRVGSETRSIVADLKQDGFVNYVYFTDFETSDPYDVTSSCYKYAWGTGTAQRPTSCGEIQFGANDVLDGAVHSNDKMVFCGAEFKAKVTTEWNPVGTNVRYKKGSGCANPKPATLVVEASEHIEMPKTNLELKKETRYDLIASDVPNPGCLYTGPTSIVFKDNGDMVVKSPWTKFTQVGAALPVANQGRNLIVGGKYVCGNPTDLASAAGATVKVPDNNLIFVQDVPALRAGNAAAQDPNYTVKTSPPNTTVKCDGYYTGPTNNRVWNRPNNGLGYPILGENYAKETGAPANAYKCQSGDLFLEGKLKGKLTVAAQNFVYVVNDVTYKTPADDVLGIVGQEAVVVWNPSTGAASNGCITTVSASIPNSCDSVANGRTIQGAILSVGHTFTVQNYASIGDRGKLNLLGSIAQKFRGPVGTGGDPGTGYDKVYKYDTRFVNIAPPKFLAPASTTYGVSTWSEINPVYNSDGTYK
ncbi:hypothetical protein EYE40_10840 [Glaciihabitans arcticus]|uniref:Uncharacterized protein n=1 Tax=Glaciihabitans arcticus TaxID=2668039 RepID=A0A4Q9GS69_9MICO|nr:hypothetical protein [Glaciihabitans arcticus]TBN57846.1 hypothetical protein EYE40_10840 [Glaciihabitans arcticus]